MTTILIIIVTIVFYYFFNLIFFEYIIYKIDSNFKLKIPKVGILLINKTKNKVSLVFKEF